MLGEIFNDVCWYKRCLVYDFTEFHPTILTKQLSACKIMALRDKNADFKKICEYGLSLVDKVRLFNYVEIFGKPELRYDTGYKEMSAVLKLAQELCKILNE